MNALNLDQLPILGIAQVATTEQLAAMALQRSVDDIKRNCRASVYWVAFCQLVLDGKVPEDFAGRGIISRCVLGWAREDAGAAMGMTWWNELSHDERTQVLGAAAGILRREPSVADAWELWRRGKISVWGSSTARTSWIGKRVIVYSGPHYGRVHQVTGVSETLAHVYHSTSGDRYAAPFCDLEEVR